MTLEIEQIHKFVVDSVPDSNPGKFLFRNSLGQESAPEKRGKNVPYAERHNFRLEKSGRIFDFYQYPQEENKELTKSGKEVGVTWTFKTRKYDVMKVGKKDYWGDTKGMLVSSFAKIYGDSLPDGIKNVLGDVLAAYGSNIRLGESQGNSHQITLSRPDTADRLIFQIAHSGNDRNVHGRVVFQAGSE